jgi:2-hydroxychromene-2-carboxylate isomerase/GNAT superfamily N-acetyltransferase
MLAAARAGWQGASIMSDCEDHAPFRPILAGPADAPRLAALSRAAYAPMIAVIGAEPEPHRADYAAILQEHEAWLVPGTEGELAGAVILRWAADHVLIWSVAVAPARQHGGLGRRLLAFAETLARERGIGVLRLYTNRLMRRNRSLYARLGYYEVRRETRGDRVVVHMTKQLGPEAEFWFELASPYSYIAAERIEALAAARGVAIRWQPFLLGALFKRRPGNESGFQEAPEPQRRYRRRDVERLTRQFRLPLVPLSVYPRPSLLAARVALAGLAEGWCPRFARACFRANFAEDRDIADATTIGEILTDLGLEADEVLAAARAPENKAALAATVERALDLGIFGAPSFRVAGELFWGQDRLEQALAWAVEAETQAP